MNQNIEQAQHNEHFLNFVETQSPTLYFDWKITVIFYIALHYTKAYIYYNKIYKNTNSHKEIFEIIDFLNTNSKAKLPEKYYRKYLELFELSRNSRYNSITNKLHKQLLEFNYKMAKENLNLFLKYYKSLPNFDK